jgi:CRP/FNR family transcriptional regulator
MDRTGFAHSIPDKDTCFDCFKKEQCLAKRLTISDVEGLSTLISNNIKYRCGDYIYRQGDASKNIFIVKSGATKSLINSVEGNEQVIGFHFAGEVLGFDALDTNIHVSSVIALENSIICGFPRQLLDRLCARDATFQKELIARFSREIVRDYQLLILINKKNAEQRVAIFLLELLVRMGCASGQIVHLDLVMSRADIANYLGLVPETVSRVLSKFERIGMLVVKKKKLQIVDDELLVKYSNDHPFQKPPETNEVEDAAIPLALLY